MIRDFAGKMDAAVWDRTFVSLKRLVDVIRSKKNLLINNPGLPLRQIDQKQLDENWPALVGLYQAVDLTGRYVRYTGYEVVGMYRAIGELEVYGAPLPSPPANVLANSVPGSNDIEISWTNPAQFDQIVVLRRDLNGCAGCTGAFNHYPFWPPDKAGTTIVYEGTDASFVDTGLEAGMRYYYAVYARQEEVGWSPPDWEGVDNAVAGGGNPNLARDKLFTSNIDFDTTYGYPQRAVDGVRGAGNATTKSAQLGHQLEGVLDLKQPRTVGRISLFQPSDLNFVMNNHTLWISDGGDFVQISSGGLNTSSAAENTFTFAPPVTARFVKVLLTGTGPTHR